MCDAAKREVCEAVRLVACRACSSAQHNDTPRRCKLLRKATTWYYCTGYSIRTAHMRSGEQCAHETGRRAADVGVLAC